MHSTLRRFLLFLGLCLTVLTVARGVPQSGGDFSNNPEAKKLPTGVILVKGAWSSASDSVTPVPEGGKVTNNVYTNDYFGLAYPFSPDWTEKYTGPPPSDGGYYVLAQVRPADTFKGTDRGSVTPQNVGDKVHLRVELQGLWRLPRSNGIVFSVRGYLISMRELATIPKWAKRVHRVLRDLHPALMDYKGLTRYRDTVVAYLAPFDDGAPTTPGTAPE